MNDSAGKTTSCLAVTEKRTHRPGGCVGIFFQLFDWNRRFAKKKLFSRKLLPSARAKQAANKFKGDEKMPTSKLHLIADENSGGFPHKKHSNRYMDLERKHEMRAPGIVARLMGLESIPAVHDTAKEGCLYDACDNGERNYSSNGSSSEREAVNMEKGSTKLDSRPQKLQKTGQFERKAVTKFGADPLQIKSVLSRSRKHHHHPKLASPIRSPRISSGKNVSRTSRLIDAATKILEPGLQSASKTKSALTYSSSIRDPPPPPSNEVKADGIVVDERPSKQSAYCSNAADLDRKSSCQNCGNALGTNFIPNAEERSSVFQPFTSNFVDGSYLEGTSGSKARIPMPSHGQETDTVSLRTWGQKISSAVQRKEEMNTTQSNFKPIAERNSLSTEFHDPRQSPYQPCRPCNDESSSITLKHKSRVLGQILPIRRDRIPPVSNVNNLQNRRVSSAANVVRETKDFIALNRSLSSRNRPRTSKIESSRISQERKAIDNQHESLPHLKSSARKRRTVNITGQVESRESASSPSMRQRNVHSNALTEKGFRLNSQSLNHTSARSRFVGGQNGDEASKRNDSGVISFTFNSPARHKTRGPMEMDKKITKNEANKSFQTPSSDADSIGALLEQKLKELTCQEDDELTTDGAPKRSTAMILQELISALIAERPDIAFQSVANNNVNLTKNSHKDHLSPGSVLDASFSSSSLDDSSGHRMYPSSVEYSDEQLQLSEPDGDLSDSATSIDKVGSSSEVVTVLINNISKIIHNITFSMGRLTDSTVANTKDVILNAELLFGSMAPQNAHVTGLVISPIFLELETIANAIWANINIFKGLEATKAENHFMEFIFDSMVECLDFRYGQYCNLGFNTWRRLPLCMTREMMIGLIAEDINKWTYLTGMATDEIIEWEMSHSRGKWTDFDVESYETGAEIDGDILQVLVHEIVLDLLECKQGCF